MHRIIRPAFLAFVIAAPTALLAVAALYVARGEWWAAAFCAVAAAAPAVLIPRERTLRRQGRGQGRLYSELREAVAASVPPGQTRLLRRYGDPVFYTVGRRPGRFGTERVLIQRFDDRDLSELGELLAGGIERGAMVCTAFQLHPWYPAVSREVHGTAVTSDGQNLQAQSAGPSAAGGDPGARRLAISTGLGQAAPVELHEMINALTRADIITGGTEPEPSL